jgi:DNA polymerase-1
MKKLYLIDGSGFIFRAFFALPPMTRADGTPVNAVYGFCNMLQKLLSKTGADPIAVLFDAARETFRQSIYPAYKANRPPPPPELVPQFSLIREATRAFGLPSIELSGFEADDLIATYARLGVEAGYEICVVSSDKDLMQLVRPHVSLFDPMKEISIGEAEVRAKFGVPPEKVIDVQALAGDSTDNVPGVPGIGIKTAAQLISDYGNLENLLEKAQEIKQPKRRELLAQNADLARISKKLVTLDDHAPVPMSLEEMKAVPDATLFQFLQSMGFKSILARMNIKAPERPLEEKPLVEEAPLPAAAIIDAKQNYECVQTTDRLKSWVEEARKKSHVALDTETDSLTPSTTTIVGFSLATEPGKACYVPLNHKSSAAGEGFSFAEDPKQIPLREAMEILRPLMADPSVLKIAHNLKFDSQVLAQHGIDIAPYDDTMLMSYVLAGGLHGHGLDELASLHLNHKMISYGKATGTGKNRVTFDRVDLVRATEYAAEDADYALRLWLFLKPQLSGRLAKLYAEVENPLVPVVADMERAGISIDPEALRLQSNDLAQRMQKLEERVFALAGHPFNLSSPKQMGEVLFNELHIQSGGKGKAGALSTSADVLEPLAEEHEIVARILDWRGLAKLKSTYTDALPQQIDGKTGRVHTSFNLVGAATGRLSSTDPNLQNIPVRTSEGRAIREAFVAREGFELLSVDYSQIELRLAAEIANISALIEAFKSGEDIHALTASQVFGIPLDQMTPDKRRQAKAVNFGIIYGISGFGLSKQLGISVGEANQFIRAYLDRFHELRDWIETTKEFARTNGYVETLFGRRVHVPGIADKNAARRAFAERQAINAPLQGTAADIIKRAMIRIPQALVHANLSARLLLQVHDELVFEVPVDEIDATSALVRRLMQEAPLPDISLKVPLIAEAGHAKNWAAAH